MTTFTWVGGGDNDSVYNPDNWSPADEPQPGDSLIFINGTASMKGGDLGGNFLQMGFYSSFTPPQPVSATPVLNVSRGAMLNVAVSSTFGTSNSSTINVKGHDTLNILGDTSPNFGPTRLQINLGPHALLEGSLSTFNERVTIDGAGKFENNDSSLAIGTIKIMPDMIGTGHTSIDLFANVELGGAVCRHQAFSFDAIGATLTIDHPDQFHGSISGPTDSTFRDNTINLLGVHADNYSITDDMLRLYDGNTLVDRLHFNDTASSTFVWQGPSGIVIGMNPSSVPADLVPLPAHCS
jgi:hypothetical protein